MKKTLASMSACIALMAVALGPPSGDETYSSEDDSVTGDPSPDFHSQGTATESVLAPLTVDDLAQTIGTGPVSDFLCGAAAGAGFALALSGVGAPAGIVLAGAGMACAMFF